MELGQPGVHPLFIKAVLTHDLHPTETCHHHQSRICCLRVFAACPPSFCASPPLLRLIELGQPGLHPLFVKQVVTVAMDRRDREREMASNLLSELHPRVITDDQVGVCVCGGGVWVSGWVGGGGLRWVRVWGGGGEGW